MTAADMIEDVKQVGAAMDHAAECRRALGVLECDKAEWLNARIAELVAEGKSVTAADKAAHADPVYAQFRRDIVQAQYLLDNAWRIVQVRQRLHDVMMVEWKIEQGGHDDSR